MRATEMTLHHVDRIPRVLQPGILYFSKERGVAMHLCCCGCGSEIMTRISGKDWLIRSRDGRPSVYPSIGNWNLPCRSHYVIINGAVIWAGDFEPEDVEAVRVAKEKAEVVFAEKSSNEQKDELRERRLNKARRFWKKF